jgi:hypothetical protein
MKTRAMMVGAVPLGGGARAGGPDEALAAFLDTLLAAVMEDL